MDAISLVEREMTDAEFARMNAGFDEHTVEHGNPVQTSDRHGFVVLDGDRFIGCASGLTHKNGARYNGWFSLTDLFIEKPYRGRGLGAAILRRLEDRVAALGVYNFWTFTAGYEAPGFYQKQGYEIAFVQEGWYASGHSRVALRKILGA